MFPNYPVLRVLETQLTFMAVGEPDYPWTSSDQQHLDRVHPLHHPPHHLPPGQRVREELPRHGHWSESHRSFGPRNIVSTSCHSVQGES